MLEILYLGLLHFRYWLFTSFYYDILLLSILLCNNFQVKNTS